MKEAALNISSNDLKVLDIWLNADVSQIPANIKMIIKNLSQLPFSLAQTAGNKEALLRLIKTLMKITPSSEKGTLLPKI